MSPEARLHNAPSAAASGGTTLTAVQAMALPLIFVGLLALLTVVPTVGAQPALVTSFLGAAALLALGAAALPLARRGEFLRLEVRLRPQHYVQACAQLAVYVYWGWYWRPVYDAAPLIAAQIVFAYAFEMLLVWSRRETYTLGFGPVPVIFSTNLFLWFKPDWFYLQFLMIALGFAAKELIRWNRDGRRTHIFNPSSFPLGIVSLALILTGATSLTWAEEIATTQFNPPQIYLFLFLIALPGQFLFGVTTMTMSAVLATYLFGLAFYAATGTYYFVDSYIPTAVFLGMNLLFTDPSTSPRTESGRVLFGAMYGLSNVLLYGVLGIFGLPKFYDKLLPVPIMNLSVRFLDRFAPRLFGALDPARLAAALASRRRNAAYVAVWVGVFAVLFATGGVGDNHPGHRVPFWQQACAEGRFGACENLRVMVSKYCNDGSGWACNELGVLGAKGEARDATTPADPFQRACALGFRTGCTNELAVSRSADAPRSAPPRLEDYPVILRTGKGALSDRTPEELLHRACQQGWMQGCEDLGEVYLRGAGTSRDPSLAAAAFKEACDGGLGAACSNLGYMYYSADGMARDRDKGLALLKRSCDLGFDSGCRWYEENKGN